MGPYYYFLKDCINKHKSSTKVYNVYKQRILNKKSLLDTKTGNFENDGIYYNSLLLVIESKNEGFGKIVDLYGDSNFLEIDKQDLLGLEMGTLIPNM